MSPLERDNDARGRVWNSAIEHAALICLEFADHLPDNKAEAVRKAARLIRKRRTLLNEEFAGQQAAPSEMAAT